MVSKRIIIKLDEANCCDGCAIDEAIEKVRYLITEGFTSGHDPVWSIEDVEEEED